MSIDPRAAFRAALYPQSIALIGASDNPHKIGGRPMQDRQAGVVNLDLNPMMVCAHGEGRVAVDAVVYRGAPGNASRTLS